MKSTKPEDFSNIWHGPQKCLKTCLLVAISTKKWPSLNKYWHILTHILQFCVVYFFGNGFCGGKST